MTELLEQILKQQKSMSEKLTLLLNKPRKQTWVSVRFIQDLTGWNGTKLFEVRRQNIVEHRKNKAGGYEYLLESIPEEFLLKNISDE